VVGDRILLTMAISAGTILFTWALAIPDRHLLGRAAVFDQRLRVSR
jgi:hypothetical protein